MHYIIMGENQLNDSDFTQIQSQIQSGTDINQKIKKRKYSFVFGTHAL